MQPEKKNDLIKASVQYAAVFLIIMLLSVAGEILVFNTTALFHSYEPVECTLETNRMSVETVDSLAQLSGEEQKAILVEQENKRLLAEYNGVEYVEELDESWWSRTEVFTGRSRKPKFRLNWMILTISIN